MRIRLDYYCHLIVSSQTLLNALKEFDYISWEKINEDGRFKVGDILFAVEAGRVVYLRELD